MTDEPISFAEASVERRGYAMWEGRKVQVLHSGVNPNAKKYDASAIRSRENREVQKIEIKTVPPGDLGGTD